MSRVRIFYSRPPAPPTIFDQALIHDGPDAIITLGLDLQLPSPKLIEGRIAMEPGSSIVWFTFPDLWHDIGKCYLRDGTFTGTYANILTPVEIPEQNVWYTTDLCLDVWVPPDGEAVLLDQDALDAAVAAGAITGELAARAREEAARLLDSAASGSWPPPVCDRWDLDRALAVLNA